MWMMAFYDLVGERWVHQLYVFLMGVFFFSMLMEIIVMAIMLGV